MDDNAERPEPVRQSWIMACCPDCGETWDSCECDEWDTWDDDDPYYTLSDTPCDCDECRGGGYWHDWP